MQETRTPRWPDYELVEALEYGMPPTCGFGLSERLFSFLMDKPMRECQIFPLMKPKNKSKTKNQKSKCNSKCKKRYV